MTGAPTVFRWRTIVLPALVPTALFSIGEGTITPMIPIIAHHFGADLATAGLVAAMIPIGRLAGDLPAGWVVARIGERRAMLGGAVLSMAGIVATMLAPVTWMLALGAFLLGLASTVFALARHAFMTVAVPYRVRARALSTVGGVYRGGWFVGPFLAAGLVALTGQAGSVFWVHLAAAGLVTALLLVLPDPEAGLREHPAHPTVREAEAQVHGLFRTLFARRGDFLRVGSGAAILTATRASRTVVLPLWAVSLGVDPQFAALVIGVSGALDFALFFTSGQIMDRWGRLWAAVPALIGLAAGHFVLAGTHGFDAAVTWFVVGALVLGLSNGVSSGINMTLGSDLAGRVNPAPFLGGWRFVTDAGGAAAPVLISVVTSLAGLPLAAAVMGVLSLAGAGILARNVPRVLPARER